MGIEIPIVFLGIIIFFSSLKWRVTIKAVLLLVVIEGAIRKWLLPQASEIIYFIKDILLFGAYIGYFSSTKLKHQTFIKSYAIKILTFLVVGWCVFQAFNPSLGSPILGFFGLRGYIFYIPLMWMVAEMFESEEELYKFLRSYLLLVIPIGILGIAQFFSPPTSFINAYTPGEVKEVATFGAENLARITGTFSYISGYGIYLMVCFGLLIGFLSIKQSQFWRWIAVIEIFLVTLNSLMTGSRGVVLTLVLFLLGYVALKGFIEPTKTLNLLPQLLLPAIVVVFAASIWFRPAIDAFWLRTTANKDASGRVSSGFTETLEFIKFKEFDGYGTGATHQAAPMLRRALSLPPGEYIPTTFEGEMGRVALEIGPFGFLLWYGFRITLAITLGIVFWKSKRPLLRQLAIAAFLIEAINIPASLVFSPTFSVYSWFLNGFIFLLPRLEQIENVRRQQQLIQPDVPSTYLPSSPYR